MCSNFFINQHLWIGTDIMIILIIRFTNHVIKQDISKKIQKINAIREKKMIKSINFQYKNNTYYYLIYFNYETNSQNYLIISAEIKLYCNCSLILNIKMNNFNLIKEILKIFCLNSHKLKILEYKSVFSQIINSRVPFELFLKNYNNLFTKCPLKEQKVYLNSKNSTNVNGFNNYLNDNQFRPHELSLESLCKNKLK